MHTEHIANTINQLTQTTSGGGLTHIVIISQTGVNDIYTVSPHSSEKSLLKDHLTPPLPATILLSRCPLKSYRQSK